MSVIQVFIVTHNRPKLVINAIQSILKQKCDSFEVIVSDNSTNEDTDENIKHIEDNRLIYKRRIPALSPADHFNTILHDVTAEYFMIFHDDDIMHHDMLQRLYENIISDKDILAVGGNAKIITHDIFPNRVMLKNKKKDLLVSNRDQMAYQYLIKRGIVPFPSYLYRNEVAKKLRFDTNHGGKHSDVAFLMDIASMGKVLMLIEPLMDYIISPGQDSKTNEFLHRINLINYITKTTNYKNNSYLIKRFRIVNLYYELNQDRKTKSPISGRRRLKILKLIFKVSPFDFFPRSIFHLILDK
jgi:glycosyltransferase involved in cell wall biosynthesis